MKWLKKVLGGNEKPVTVYNDYGRDKAAERLAAAIEAKTLPGSTVVVAELKNGSQELVTKSVPSDEPVEAAFARSVC